MPVIVPVTYPADTLLSKTVAVLPIRFVTDISKTDSMLLFMLVICSSDEKLANCETNWDESCGFKGSWFFSCVTRSCKNVSSEIKSLEVDPVALLTALVNAELTLETVLMDCLFLFPGQTIRHFNGGKIEIP